MKMTSEEKPMPQVVYALQDYYKRMELLRQDCPEKPPYATAEGSFQESKTQRMIDESGDPQLQDMFINIHHQNRATRLWLGLITD